jgi:hypothetical protein
MKSEGRKRMTFVISHLISVLFPLHLPDTRNLTPETFG